MAERDLLVRILGDDRDLQRALGNTERRLESIDARTAAFGKNLKTAFAAAGITVGIATVSRGLEDIIQSSIDFEEAFAGVRKTVDGTDAEFAELAAGFREMSREIPITAVELARIGEAAGQLGVAKEDILVFTRTVADLAATTDLSTDAAADAFARLTNITGLPQSQVSNLASAVVDLGNNLAATESEIIDFAVRIAGAGRQAELTDAQIVAIAGSFRSVGVEAEAGGTAVQKVLLSMTSATLSGGKELQGFARVAGQSVEEFRRAFSQDSGAAFASFVEGLERIREEGGNAFETLKALGLSDQRLIRAFLSMSSNSQLLTDALRLGSTAFEENIALTEEAEKRYQTTASQIQIFKNNVNDLAITLGDDLVANMNDAVEVALLIRDALQEIKDLSPIEIPINVPIAVDILFAGRSTGGVKNLAGDIADQVRDAVAAGLTAGVEPFENLESLFRGEGGRGFQLFPSPVDTRGPGETTKDAADRAEDAADRAVADAERAGKAQRRAQKAWDEFVKGMGLKLDKARLTSSLDDDIAALRELERAILRRMQTEGKTFNLVQQLTNTRLQISSLVDQQADDARQAGVDAFNNTIDALNLDLEMARATKSLADDQTALRAIEQALLRRIQAEGQTTDLLRQLFNVRQQQNQVAQQLAEQRREQRQRRQFEQLGLTAEGDRPTPGSGALLRRAENLQQQIKGTSLDTQKTRNELARIVRFLRNNFKTAGKEVREAILQMLNDISSAFDQGPTGRQGPLTKTSGLNTKKVLEGLGLTAEQINELRGRLSSINSAGRQLNIGASDQGQRRIREAGFGNNPIFVESHTTINLDGQQVAKVVTKQQQKARRRNPQQKRGPNRNR